MTKVTQSIQVDVPVRTAYDQWTQFEEFPDFMEGVDEVRQLDARHNHWKTSIGGVHREFDTEIVDQMPDERITWRTIGGSPDQRGMVVFRPVDDTCTRIDLTMEVAPEGAVEKAAAALRVLDLRIKGDLKRFKEFIELRGTAWGGWRGRVTPG
ncbi:SRPBCC family protein [Yinghuangia soli]|uniref:SRPBCC family protein n=1 Tax=Yinghuangia soli TaxID=2908204 RepID=A0AA41U424_9ACTN|nr:SRPBCC family protein [Yinghuangia soli]MCF2533338.1 SRPBCC family protein [Yinghuangia soli]